MSTEGAVAVPSGDPTERTRPATAEELDRRDRRERFEHEVLTQLDPLYAFGFRLTHARDEAEDLVSETVLRAFDRWEQYRLGSNIRAWLFTILYHAFVSRKRRHDAREVALPEPSERWGALRGDGAALPGGAWEAVGEADPEGAFYASFLDAEVERALAALPADYRAAVVLSDLQGLRYAEIAGVLGIPEGTVKSRLFRGRRLLQRKLARYAVEIGFVRPAVSGLAG